MIRLAFLAATTAAVTVLALSSAAHAGGTKRTYPTWYAALQGSAVYVGDSDIQVTGGISPFAGKLSLDQGYGIGAAVGYKPHFRSPMSNFRIEAELTQRETDADTISASGFSLTDQGDVSVTSAMLNLYIDLLNEGYFRPYVGFGGGISRITLESTILSPTFTTATPTTAEDDDTELSYQLMAGVNFRSQELPFTEFGIGYRYFSMLNPEFTSAGTGGTVDFDYEAHSLEGAVRIYF